MSSQDFMKILEGTEYSFLRENEHLANKIMLLGLSGSYGYGTNREGSDVDFRGVAMQQPSDVLGLTEFEQYVDTGTDTVVYGLINWLNCCWISSVSTAFHLFCSMIS